MARDFRAELASKLTSMSDEEIVSLWSDLCNLGRAPDAPPWCDVCESFEAAGHEHHLPCAWCACSFDYHDGGSCDNGAHNWSCDCRGYVKPEIKKKPNRWPVNSYGLCSQCGGDPHDGAC